MADTGSSAGEVQQNMVQAVNGLVANFRQLKGEGCCDAYLELGKAVHILTDSWTPGHTVRGGDGNINLFQDYNAQSLHFHAQADNLSVYDPNAYNSAVFQSMSLIQHATGGAQFDAGGFFMLSPDAGVGVQPGTGRATFWNTVFPWWK